MYEALKEKGKVEPTTPRFMRTPRSLTIEITSRCNLRCRYCYFFNNPEVVYRDLPTGEWLTFFDELGSLGVMTVTLAGGEPFIREDLPVLLEGIVRNRMRFAFLSNGTLIDDEIAAFIAGTGRCEHVQVSVDGSSAQAHDSCRGKGSFEKVLRGIHTLQRHRIGVTVRVTIHQHNVHDLENIAHFLLDELGLPDFSTNSAGYMGTCCVNADEVLLNVEERKEAMATLLRLTEQYPGRISSSAGPLTDGRMWRRMEEARAQDKPAFHNGGRLTGCGCPSNKISVRADGAIVPCNMLAHMELGRINHDSLSEVWQNSPDLNQLRTRHHISLAEFEFCAGCSYIPYCTGNCPGLAYTLTGQVDHPSPDACMRRFLEEGGAIL
ncbi:MAG: SynChlorMet cassette radical SAM/SPASM protein ScmE [Desulfarculus sp.]|nr:SynChlorMet cassette radical SAM/SPASM protein ScmE [Desulfarculus sp.]MBV1740064.1 SynChlorMet cassette radical SAM/SPASM protein ScmE [Desulfarculus sp.]